MAISRSELGRETFAGTPCTIFGETAIGKGLAPAVLTDEIAIDVEIQAKSNKTNVTC